MRYSMADTRVDLILVVSAVLVLNIQTTSTKVLENPYFVEPITNITVAVGREAILACHVENLVLYKVAWLRVDTQTILTIHNHVITKNHRIGVTHSEQKVWYLHIREVKESDRGWYMCQINTDPMKSQVGYLDVVVSPDILDYPTSADMVVDEGANVALRCVARGSPEPTITWKRENGASIPTRHNKNVLSTTGAILNITRVKREHMGPYLCIASNGVPPSVSKRIILVVQFPPSVWIQYQLVGAYDGQKVDIECHSEAFPKSITYWTNDKGEIILRSRKFTTEKTEDSYKVHMKLTIHNLGPGDYGIYKCVSKNSLGEMEGTINVYRIPNPHIRNKYLLNRSKSSTKEANDVTYQIGSPEKDRADSLLLEDEYYSCAHQTTFSRMLVVLWLRVLSNYIPFM